MNIDYFESSLGILRITADSEGILSLGFCEQMDENIDSNTHIEKAIAQLEEYFSGNLQKFDLELNFNGATDFFQKVWFELIQIPFGRTVSYLDIARKLGDEKAVRAVGMANGKNPIAIVVPCHRVIGSDGSLTGYAYGIDIKRKLLALENPTSFAINGSLF